MIYNLVTLNNLRQWLNLSSSVDLSFLHSLQLSVSDAIKNYCQREFVVKNVIEHYSGSGRRILILENSPIYINAANDNFTLSINAERLFTSEDIVDASDYAVESRRGIIKTDFTIPWGNNNIQVDYYSGISRFTILAGQNDTIDISDSGGTDAIILTAGNYSAEDFQSEVESKLNASVTLNGTYTVLFTFEAGLWKISADESFSLLFGNGINVVKSFAPLMGFLKGNNFIGETEYISDGNFGLPNDITLAAQKLVHHWFKDSGQGEGIDHLKRKVISGGSGGGTATLEYVRDELPADVKLILDHYRIKHVIV
jgi:hypothetical protein